MSLWIWAALAVAGGFGAVCRFALDSWVSRLNPWSVPVGIWAVNVSACFALGVLAGWALGHPGASGVVAVVGTGFLGGFSTFSTACVEGARLVMAGRILAGVIHSGSMMIVSVLAAGAGLAAGMAAFG